MAEHGTWVIFAGLDTLLIGDTVFGRLNEILGGTNDANDRKNTKRYRQIALPFSVRERTAETIANGLGNIATATAAMTVALLLANASAENDGINDFRYRDVIDK